MNSQTEFKLFDIKHEVDPLFMTEMNSELQHIGSKVKTEKHECGDIIKQETVFEFVASICPISEEEKKEGSLDVWFQDYKEKSQDDQINIEEDEANVVPVAGDNCESTQTDLEEDKNDGHVCDDRGEEVNALHVHKNQFFQCNVSTENFKCKICYKTFSNKGNLNVHLDLHTGEKRFACSFCSKSFSNKYNLNTHTRIHTKEEPFKCNFCKVSFARKSTLVVHIRTHTNEKPFTCNVCSMSFSTKSLLSRHVRTHTNEKPFTCNICGMSFSEKPNLTRHTRIHTNEKPFVCNVCDMSFSQKSTINQHMFTHTKEKPFICNICNKSFTRKSDLARHKRRTIHMKSL